MPAKHYSGAHTQRSLEHFAIGWRSQDHFGLNVYTPVIAFAFLESLALLADAVDSFRRHCVEGLAVNRKRIDELMG